MTDNLYETNQFNNHTNRTYLFQHSPSALGVTHYGVPNVSLIQSSPMSPLLNHEQLTSPGTPAHELSPMLDMPNSAGDWEYNQFGRSSWGSSNEELEETNRIYPFNITSQNNSSLTCKDNGSASHPQRLDSFSQAFPTKNIHPLFGDSNRTDDKHSENQISGCLHLPQSLPEGSDRQSLESPIFNTMVIQGQTQMICEQPDFHLSESQHSLHGLYQNHQQFHYGYQQHKQKVNNMEQVNRSLHKPQSPWHHQHGYQSHPMSYPMALNQQQKGIFAHKTRNDSLESHEPVQSPTYGHRQDFKVPEQQIFHYQDQQYLRSLSQPGNPYLTLQSQDQSIPAKQNNMFSDHSAPSTPVFSSPKEDQSGFNFPQRSEDLCSPLYQSKSSGVCKALPQATMRGDIFQNLTAHAPQWSQASSPDIQDEAISPHFRAEPGLSREEGSHTKMRCTVCQREFKSLPALNGHMRSHGGLRTQPTSLKMRDGHIHLSTEVAQTNPIILPVSVPVKDYQTPNKLMLNLLCHQKDDQSGLIKCGAQSPLASVQNHPSCIKRSASDEECAPKQVKKRYRHCLVPLMIPPPGAGQESRGAVLFRSQLRTASSMGDDVPYTPPPMLSPARPGSGLFSAVSGRGKSSESSADGVKDDCGETSREKAINVTPHINVGKEFQAKIPNIQSKPLTEEDTHNAVLLWLPTKDLDTPDNQQKVENLLKMACSSVLPGGGANTEYVLHCLFECRGDIMNTLEKLLLSTLNTSSHKTDYHYAGSDRWTLQEKRQLNKALLNHHKDFHLVQKMVKTKSVSQCVEYYYTWKKHLRLGTRISTALATPVQDQRGDWAINNTAQPNKESNSKISENSSAVFVCEVSNSQTNGETWNQNNLRLLCSSPAEHRASTLTQSLGSASVRSSPSNSTTSGDTDSALVFPCSECGKVFLKVKSRNAHMKTHRQQEDTPLWQFPRVSEPDHVIATRGCHATPLKQAISLHSLPYDRTTEVKTSLNDMRSESVQEIDHPLKTLPVHSPLDYIPS
ncbi:transcriptional-regulating factor 1 isoform X1 [Rhinichthys klamathensis goyatoka]|uniref:transcriptional-regulating factor 1 isoform X1 n=1 Tax=Rhinichthys klamathensis goyatoka TaxID=3034132 RepID=UPI0024B54F33|nr:transcriptional-regulating factor 1 isoform X1 [Rhinichthys klamathensis goyatoka]XP_056111951.1 transcriptional-regulating factor 1 isoform X1 [Rhinichthys klamathensis goyatoka]